MKRGFLLLSIFLLVALAAGCNLTPPGVPTGPSTQPPTAWSTLPANPTTATPAAIPQTGIEDLNIFSQNLAAAVEAKDLQALRSMMGSSFTLAGWRSEGRTLTPEQAVQELQAGPLAQTAQPKAVFDQDVAALLGGADPLEVMAPGGNGVRALFVTGLGVETRDEGLWIIARDPSNNQLYLQGLLTAFNGFIDEPAAGDANGVTYVQVNEDIHLRAGPGTNYPSLGLVFAGMGLEVTGKSSDGAWWQVRCDQAASGQCWVSADPSLTSPAQRP